MQSAINGPARYCFSLAALLALAFGFQGSRGIYSPDEGYYVSVSQAMAQTGDWLIPRLHQIPWLDKPPLSLWGIAAGLLVFGQNEWGARAFHALCYAPHRPDCLPARPQFGNAAGELARRRDLRHDGAPLYSRQRGHAGYAVGVLDHGGVLLFLENRRTRRAPHRPMETADVRGFRPRLSDQGSRGADPILRHVRFSGHAPESVALFSDALGAALRPYIRHPGPELVCLSGTQKYRNQWLTFWDNQFLGRTVSAKYARNAGHQRRNHLSAPSFFWGHCPGPSRGGRRSGGFADGSFSELPGGSSWETMHHC